MSPILSDNGSSNLIGHLELRHKSKWIRFKEADLATKVEEKTRNNNKRKIDQVNGSVNSSTSSFTQQSIFGGAMDKPVTKQQLDREFAAWLVMMTVLATMKRFKFFW